MDVPKQPPPGPDQLEELPPEGWRGTSPQRFWAWVVGGVIVIVCGTAFLPPMFLRSRKAGERTEAISNAKQIGQALLEFELEYGTFPSDATAPLVAARTGSGLDFSDGSSNAMFRQLIAFGINSEGIFYCEHPEGSRRPDGVTRGRRALEAGEAGFSYVHGLDSTMNPSLPLLAAPMKSGTETFWDKPFEGKAVVLRIDNSVDALEIGQSDGKAVWRNGQPLFDPANGPWPSGWKIDLRHPAR